MRLACVFRSRAGAIATRRVLARGQPASPSSCGSRKRASQQFVFPNFSRRGEGCSGGSDEGWDQDLVLPSVLHPEQLLANVNNTVRQRTRRQS